MIKVALAQYRPSESLDRNIDLVRSLTERAGQEGADLLCFSDSFLGFEADQRNSAVEQLLDFALRFNVEVVCGRVRLADKSWAQSVLVGRDGRLIDWVPDGDLKALRTCLGTTLVLTERQAYSPNTDLAALQLKPKVMIMQTSAISLLELEAIKELAIDRSYNQAHLVVCTSVVGECRDEVCLGTSLAVFQGEILAEADTGAGELVIFGVDPTKFIEYDELRDAVVIPELLRQKYAPHDRPPHFGAE